MKSPPEGHLFLTHEKNARSIIEIKTLEENARNINIIEIG